MTTKANIVKKTKKSKLLQPEEFEKLILDYVKQFLRTEKELPD